MNTQKGVEFSVSELEKKLSKMESKLVRQERKIEELNAAKYQASQDDKPIAFNEITLNPGVIGCTGFSLATVLLGFRKMEIWDPTSDPILALWGFFIGGVMQVQAGIYEHKCGNYFSAWAFTLFGWNWMATGLELGFPSVFGGSGLSAGFMKALWMQFFCLALFIVSFRVSLYHIPMMFFVWMIFVCECVGFNSEYNRASWEYAAGVFAVMSGYMALLHAFSVVTINFYKFPFFPFFPYPYTKENMKIHLGRKNETTPKSNQTIHNDKHPHSVTSFSETQDVGMDF